MKDDTRDDMVQGRCMRLLLGVVICVYGSCLYRVNIQIVLIFVNSNPTRIINVSIFVNSNSTHLLFVLGMSIRI